MTPAEPAAQGYWTSGRRNVVLLVLCLVGLFNFVDRQIITSLVQPIQAEFGASDTLMGFLIGPAFALIYALTSIPIARMADLHSRRVVISICLGLWSLMTTLGGLAQAFWQVAASRVGVAVGESGAGPASHSLLMDLYGVGRRGTVIGLLSGMQAIGIGGGVLLGGVLSEAFGWRAAFLIVGVPGLILALIVRFGIKEPPRGLSEAVQVDQPPPPPLLQVLKRLFSTPGYALSVATVGLGGLGGYGMLNWGPTFFGRVHEMSPSQVGIYFGSATAAALFAGIVGSGIVADWAGRRDIRAYMWVAAAGPLLCLPFALWFIYERDWRLALVAYVLMTFIQSPHNNCSYAMAQTLTPVRMRAISSVIMGLTTTMVGIGIGPLLIGISNDLLKPQFGDMAIRYSLTLILLGFVGAGITGFLSTRFVKRDYERLQQEIAAAAAKN